MQLKVTKSNATTSRRSEVTNLCSFHPTMSFKSVCSAIADEFYTQHGVTENRKVRMYYNPLKLFMYGIWMYYH